MLHSGDARCAYTYVLHVYTYIHIYIYTYIHIYIYTYIHVFKYMPWRMLTQRAADEHAAKRRRTVRGVSAGTSVSSIVCSSLPPASTTWMLYSEYPTVGWPARLGPSTRSVRSSGSGRPANAQLSGRTARADSACGDMKRKPSTEPQAVGNLRKLPAATDRPGSARKWRGACSRRTCSARRGLRRRRRAAGRTS